MRLAMPQRLDRAGEGDQREVLEQQEDEPLRRAGRRTAGLRGCGQRRTCGD